MISDFFNYKNDQHPANTFYGITVGVVTNIDDPEKLGRLKVKLLNRDTSVYETDFIRVMTPMSGDKWGAFFFPEIGDEVLVGFGGGDISRPYVLGSLWNSKNNVPITINDGKNDIRKIKTKSGHEIIFNDEKDKESINIITPKGLNISMEDKDLIINIKDKEGKNIIKINSKDGIIDINSDKKINFASGNSKITLDGNGNKINLESSSSISLKSQQIVLDSKGALDIKATGNINIKSNGPTSVKGAVVKIN